MNRPFGLDHTPILCAFAMAYRAQAEVETGRAEICALMRLAKKTDRNAKELENA